MQVKPIKQWDFNCYQMNIDKIPLLYLYILMKIAITITFHSSSPKFIYIGIAFHACELFFKGCDQLLTSTYCIIYTLSAVISHQNIG